ncbi:hypothetical protein [Streptomyces sp. NRRL F-5135]|uniref:hypothetical protein n=1 Tax=Streptomyces sp. NRRL F-5135 TaxID=1463858 RepID=UPI000AF02F56|nr:hypothetical protein [Streptomyces sp. NRRL F-5135]
MLAARIRAVALAGTGLSCLAMAVLYGQARLWPAAFVLATGAAVCADTARHVCEAAAERRALAVAAEHAARHDGAGPSADASHGDAVLIELSAACCEMWWTSIGTEHTQDCTRQRGT